MPAMNETSRAGRLLIRADAGPRVGNGHVMRCLALAQAWQDAGGEATFACAELPHRLRQRLRAERCRVASVDAAPGTSRDAECVRALVNAGRADVIVLDGYDFSFGYQKSLERSSRLRLVIDDDGCHGSYCADVILNQNLHADPALYRRRSGSAQLLMGTRYMLLRREFREFVRPRRTFPRTAHRILVMVGGSAPGGPLERILRSVAALGDAGANVLILSPADLDARRMRCLATRLGIRLTLAVDPVDLPQQMFRADAAVTAAGSTAWELSSLGVPMLAFPLAANQRRIAATLEQSGLALVAHPRTRLKFDHAFARLLRDAGLRRKLSRAGTSTLRARSGAVQVVTSLLARLGH